MHNKKNIREEISMLYDELKKEFSSLVRAFSIDEEDFVRNNLLHYESQLSSAASIIRRARYIRNIVEQQKALGQFHTLQSAVVSLCNQIISYSIHGK